MVVSFEPLKPTEPGWYEFASPNYLQAAYWDGKTWTIRGLDRDDYPVSLAHDALVIRRIGD